MRLDSGEALPVSRNKSSAVDMTRLGIPAHLLTFEPDHAAALRRLASVLPSDYARSRNAIDGAVTGLSPYFTHGILGLRDAAQHIDQRHRLSFDDKLVFEFAWREFFHHVWSRAGHNGDAIFKDMHGQLPWQGQYADTLPADIREGRTGVAAIDNAVRILYATGYLHNHLRMWIASYVVHVRKVHWRAGADWLYGHLLDGDLASNHLSWQWVAATFSSKPYLFNAENVSKYAPRGARAAWDCSGTVIDQSYEALDDMARNQSGKQAERGQHAAVDEPVLSAVPCEPFDAEDQSIRAQAAINNIAVANGTALELIHPFNLAPRDAAQSVATTLHDVERSPASTLRVGVIHLPAHAQWLWSEKRWQFVLTAMVQTTDAIWVGDVGKLMLPKGVKVSAQATLFPGYRDALGKTATLTEAPHLLPSPSMACRSFTKFYERARRDVDDFASLL